MKVTTVVTGMCAAGIFVLGVLIGKEYQIHLYESKTTTYYSDKGYKRVRTEAPSLNEAQLAISNVCQNYGYEIFNTIPKAGRAIYYAQCGNK